MPCADATIANDASPHSLASACTIAFIAQIAPVSEDATIGFLSGANSTPFRNAVEELRGEDFEERSESVNSDLIRNDAGTPFPAEVDEQQSRLAGQSGSGD
ncbi:hypothetical protein MML47_15955 [Xanthomonas oryzae]|nr:hypothetical protein [Xanthomonas oryzae]UNE64860.1 hypothetical protein MML47_15955 [Xanthomonas oryzae]